MNVAIFWSLAGLMMALAMAVLVLPLLRSRTLAATDSRRLTNASIYRDQLEELERDRQSGSIAQADYEASRVEIERRLLEDASLPARPSTAAHGGKQLLFAADRGKNFGSRHFLDSFSFVECYYYYKTKPMI